MSPSPVPADQERGWIIPVGGAEDKLRNPTILEGDSLTCAVAMMRKIVVIPTASQLEDTGHRYETLFKELGAQDSTALPIMNGPMPTETIGMTFLEMQPVYFLPAETNYGYPPFWAEPGLRRPFAGSTLRVYPLAAHRPEPPFYQSI